MTESELELAIYKDPPRIDPLYPPDMMDLSISSTGTRLNGLIYLAAGAGPHPTILFLHGYPGNERNLDLAQIVRRAGYNAVYFNYRGSWGTGGTFSWTNAVADTHQVVRYMRTAEVATRLRINPNRIVLVGHSLGGWVALEVLAKDAALRCAATIAGYNLGRAGAAMRGDEEFRKYLTAYFGAAIDPVSGPIRGNGQDLVQELITFPERYDLLNHAAALRDRSLLLISGTKDTAATTDDHHTPHVHALKNAGAKRVLDVVFQDADHNFSAFRVKLAQTVLKWLNSGCNE